MAIKVNFTNVESFEPLPAGSYPVVVTDSEVKESKTSEYPYINLELTVKEGEFENRKLWAILSTSPKAAWKMKQQLEALTGNDFDNDEMELEEGDLVGCEAMAIVSQESYDGRLVNRVQDFAPMDTKPAKPAAGKPAAGKPATKGPRIK